MRDVLRLGALLACVALATTRLGLLAHELVGHGGMAVAVGAKVTDVRLFWFAGGWIRYSGVPSAGASLAIAMGGIAVETVCATALWLAVRGDSLGLRILRGTAAAIVVHAGWYLATGAFAGYGDGIQLYHVLGAARVPVALAAAAVSCGAAFLGAREVLGALAATQPRHRIAATATALALAGGLHAGLTFGELHVRNDRLYTGMMKPERTREIAQEVARWQAAHPEAAAAARADEVQRIEAAHPPAFPFKLVLALAIAAAVLAGAFRSKPGQGGITRRLLVQWAVAAAIAIAIVIAV
jgi:hypothetical protein